jgi:hypothetical protein
MAPESNVKSHEIFVYCVSQTLSAAIAQEFNAAVCGGQENCGTQFAHSSCAAARDV